MTIDDICEAAYTGFRNKIKNAKRYTKQIKAMMKRIDSKVWGTTYNVEV